MNSTAKVKVFEDGMVIETYYQDIAHKGAFDALDVATLNLHSTTYKGQIVRTHRNPGNQSTNLYLGDGRIVYIQILA